MTFSLFDHPHFQTLLGRPDLAALFSAEAEIEGMLRFEVALADAEAKAGVIPKAAATAITDAASRVRPEIQDLLTAVARDGLPVTVLVDRLRADLDATHRPYLHLGATSQDLVDTGLMLRLKTVLEHLREDIETVVRKLLDIEEKRGHEALMGRTRMQAALPMQLADRLRIWRHPLAEHLKALGRLEERLLVVQFGGPIGTLDALGERGGQVRALLAEALALADPGRCWHTDRSRIVDLANWLSKVSGSLGKLGQDVALMAQNEIGEAMVASGGRSSAMAHKRNPVQAEWLVTLARFNAGQLGSLHQAMVHEGERSGSAWSLEWLILPQMVAATGASLTIADKMIGSLEFRPSSSTG